MVDILRSTGYGLLAMAVLCLLIILLIGTIYLVSLFPVVLLPIIVLLCAYGIGKDIQREFTK